MFNQGIVGFKGEKPAKKIPLYAELSYDNSSCSQEEAYDTPAGHTREHTRLCQHTSIVPNWQKNAGKKMLWQTRKLWCGEQLWLADA